MSNPPVLKGFVEIRDAPIASNAQQKRSPAISLDRGLTLLFFRSCVLISKLGTVSLKNS